MVEGGCFGSIAFGLCRRCCRSVEGGYRRGRRQREALNELTPCHLSLFEVLNQLCDDLLHKLSSSGSLQGLPASLVILEFLSASCTSNRWRGASYFGRLTFKSALLGNGEVHGRAILRSS